MIGWRRPHKTDSTFQKGIIEVRSQQASPPRNRQNQFNIICSTAHEFGIDLSKYLKTVKMYGSTECSALIEASSSFCTMTASTAVKCHLNITATVRKLFGFGNVLEEASPVLGSTTASIDIDSVLGGNIELFIVPDSAVSRCPYRKDLDRTSRCRIS